MLDVGLNTTVTAALLEVNYSALAKSLEREREKHAASPVLQTSDRLTVLKERVDRVIDALMHQEIVKKLAREARLDVLVFPGNDNSAAHLENLFALFKSATATIDVNITLGKCVGSRVNELFDAGIAVHVHRAKLYTHHERIVIVDSKTVVHGPVNSLKHAMASGGLMVIDEDWRFVQPVLQYFDG